MNTTQLTTAEIERYERQLILPDWNERAQLELKNSTALLESRYWMGACYLSAAGIGGLTLSGKEILSPSIQAHLSTLNPSSVLTRSDEPHDSILPHRYRFEIERGKKMNVRLYYSSENRPELQVSHFELDGLTLFPTEGAVDNYLGSVAAGQLLTHLSKKSGS